MAKDSTQIKLHFLIKGFNLSDEQIDALTPEQETILNLPYLGLLISKGKLLTKEQDNALQSLQDRKRQSVENALALSSEEGNHLNHLGLWALIDAGMISVDRARTITPAQAEILDKHEVLKMLGVTVVYPSAPVDRYRYGTDESPVMPVQAKLLERFGARVAEITLERALTLTHEQVAFITDIAGPRPDHNLSMIMVFSGTREHMNHSENPSPYMMTVEQALSLPPGALTALKANIGGVRKRQLTIEGAIKVAPNSTELSSASPAEKVNPAEIKSRGVSEEHQGGVDLND